MNICCLPPCILSVFHILKEIFLCQCQTAVKKSNKTIHYDDLYHTSRQNLFLHGAALEYFGNLPISSLDSTNCLGHDKLHEKPSSSKHITSSLLRFHVSEKDYNGTMGVSLQRNLQLLMHRRQVKCNLKLNIKENNNFY